MPDTQVFTELSNALGEKERKDLLRRINKSLNIRNSLDNSVYHSDLQESEREHLINEEILKSDLWTKFKIWLYRIFSGKEKKSVYLNIKIQNLKKTIQNKMPGISGFETRNFTSVLARRIFDIYKKNIHLIPFFKTLWSDTEVLESIVNNIINERIHRVKVSLRDLISSDELEERYKKTGKKEDIKRIVIHKLDQYFSSIPKYIFKSIEEIMYPYYYLKDIVLFPYSAFFQLFGVDINEPYKGDYPNFRDCSVGLALIYLEKLYYCFYVANKIKPPMGLSDDVIEELVKRINKEEIHTNLTNPSDQDLIFFYKKQLELSLEIITKSMKTIPLIEIIRYFKNDPYYKLQIYISKLNLFDFYYASLKIKVLGEIDKNFNDIKRKVVDSLILKVFNTNTINVFKFYSHNNKLNLEDLGLPYYSYIESLAVLSYFISNDYKNLIREVVQVLGQSILIQQKYLQNKLFQDSSSIEDLENKLITFDLSHAPDADEGKEYTNLSINIENDLHGQQKYRKLISRVDKEAKGLLEKGMDAITGLLKTIKEVQSLPLESIRSQLSVTYQNLDSKKTLGSILNEISDLLQTILIIIDQLVSLES